MSRFVIADIGDPKISPQELQLIKASRTGLPVKLILAKSVKTSVAFADFIGADNFLEPFVYTSQDHLLASLADHVVKPAIDRANAIEDRRKRAIEFYEAHNREAGP